MAAKFSGATRELTAAAARRACCTRTSDLAAADGVDDFHAVAFVQRVRRVLAAWDDLAIDFNGDPTAGVADACEQRGDRSGRLTFAGFAVEDDLHARILVGR